MHARLRFHLAYRCRDSGVCCTSGWPIPVETPLFRTLDDAMTSRRLAAARSAPAGAFVEANLPPEYARVLAMDAHGACVFHDATHRRCAIHQALGPEAKPLSCRAFPFIVVRDPRGVSVSLSHYCPSAADLLFGDDPIELVDVPPAPDLEGLDARDALPPPLRDDVLIDWDSLTAWDHHVAAVFERASSAGAALDRLWRDCRALDSWRPGEGPLVDRVKGLADPGAEAPGSHHAELVAAVLSAIPEPLRPPVPKVGDESGVWRDVRYATSKPLCRYLAARGYACWPLHQGAHGLRSQLVYLEAALACVETQRAAGGDLREAIRVTDLWLLHLASPSALAAALDATARRSF